MNIEKIISAFGSQIDMANTLNVNASTVAQWKRRGNIPSNRIRQIIETAKKQNLPITAADFFEAA